MGFMRLVIKKRPMFPNDGLRINIVFHVPGPIVQPDYTGIHATKLDKKTATVLIVAAVPDTLKFDMVSRYVADVLREGRQRAIEYAAKRSVLASPDHVSGLIDYLVDEIQAATDPHPDDWC